MWGPLGWLGWFYPFIRVLVSMHALHWLDGRLWFIRLSHPTIPDYWSPALTGALQWGLFLLGLHLAGDAFYPEAAYWFWAWISTVAVFCLPASRQCPFVRPCHFGQKLSIPLVAVIYQIAIVAAELFILALWFLLRLIFS